ncbi:hypothetical protein [Catenovulum agarivorans]|uniref:hypothetical protein n=1 Tax=Catenovulum agarivorans TaxID=1172192 RepID=UPI0003641B2C|nr:hypothetical protein [Catenovulum agarivorans]
MNQLPNTQSDIFIAAFRTKFAQQFRWRGLRVGCPKQNLLFMDEKPERTRTCLQRFWFGQPILRPTIAHRTSSAFGILVKMLADYHTNIESETFQISD